MKLYSIKENHLYSKAYKKGKRFSGRYVSVYVLNDYAAERLTRADTRHKRVNRVGITVTKKLGGAVQRNRVKRIIREGYRDVERVGLRRGCLIVLVARDRAVGAKTRDIREELFTAFGTLGLAKGKRSDAVPADMTLESLTQKEKIVDNPAAESKPEGGTA